MLPSVITGPLVFLLGSPFKLAMWVGNRILTWTGLMVLWRKLKHAPDRVRRFLVVGLALNAVSLLLLVGFLHYYAHR